MTSWPDARDVDRSPSSCPPSLRDANPARAVLVALPVPVPVELHLHAAVLVRVDLIARLADDDRRLRALHHRFRRAAFGPERRLRFDGIDRDVKIVTVRRATCFERV